MTVRAFRGAPLQNPLGYEHHWHFTARRAQSKIKRGGQNITRSLGSGMEIPGVFRVFLFAGANALAPPACACARSAGPGESSVAGARPAGSGALRPTCFPRYQGVRQHEASSFGKTTARIHPLREPTLRVDADNAARV
jgi:hypothetical protein